MVGKVLGGTGNVLACAKFYSLVKRLPPKIFVVESVVFVENVKVFC